MGAYSGGFLRQRDGRWVGVLKYRDASGRWRQATRVLLPLPAGRAAAESAFRAWRAEMEAAAAAGDGPAARAAGASPGPAGAAAGASPAPGASPGPTVGEAVLSCLDAELALGRIERSTHAAQLGYARAHVLPALGGAPLSSLTPALLEAWAASLAGSLSPASARVAWNVLRKACARARRDGLLGGDPFEGASPPRAARPRPAHLGAPERRALAGAAARSWGPGSARSCAVALGLCAGLRAGECCGLRWRDASGGEVRVRASAGRAPGGGYLKAPKTPASAREVPAVGPLAAALAARRAEVERAEGGLDPAWFVCGERGDFASPKALSAAFSRLCSKEGIRDSLGRPATFHVLRHTFATVAVAAGVDVKTLSSMLGHASAKVTLDVYAAADPDARRAAASKLERALG